MRYLTTLLFLFSFYLLKGQTSLSQKIKQAYERLEADPQMAFASASLTVLNADNGEVLFSKNGNMGLAPASSLKTITAATAFYLLGSDFTYETNLAYTGTISPSGILDGDVYILGGGDPSLGSWRFDQTKTEVVLGAWLNAIKNAGIKQIKGQIIADDHLFGTQIIPDGWIWQDVGNYYGGGASSLSWRENQFDVYIRPGNKVGESVTLKSIFPAMPYIQFVNEVLTGKAGTGDQVYAYMAPNSNLIYLRGTYAIDLSKPVSPAIPDPALDLAYRLADTLQIAGIPVAKGTSSWRKLQSENISLNPNYRLIHNTRSPSLSALVYWFNRKSINLYGENFLKTFAWKKGKPTHTADAVSIVKDFWQEKLNIDPRSLNIYDGSGLSPANRVTTQSMARILQFVRKEPWYAPFYESLPLYNQMKMKSGSIADVLAYAGYHTNAGGQNLVFSFMINNYNGSTAAIRQKMFRVLDELK